MIGIALVLAPLIMSVLGYAMFFSSTPLIYKIAGLNLMFFSGIVATSMFLFMWLLSPSSFKIVSAKLRRKDILLVMGENRKYSMILGKFESGWVWLKDKLGFIVSSPDDVAFLDGVPVYVCYRGVGKTLNPKALVDLQILERALPENEIEELKKKLFGGEEYYSVLEEVNEFAEVGEEAEKGAEATA